MSSSVGRPAGVSVVVVLVVLNGLASVATGVLFFFAGGSADVDTTATKGTLVTLGVIYLVIGLVYLSVARGLWNGSNGARTLANVVTVLRLLASVWVAVVGTSAQRTEAVITGIIAILILTALNSARAKAFFLAT
jgi:hypothetical protein